MAEAVAAIEAKLANGDSKSAVMVDIIISLFNAGTSDAKWGNALLALNNKVDVAEWFSVEKAVSSENVSELRAILSTVTEDPATATAAKDDKNLPGVTEVFTANLDSLSGGSGSDSFSGVIDATGTIQVGDSLDGAGSYDTLRVVAISGGLDTTATNVTNIEEVIITESSTVVKNHNLSTISGLEKLTVNSTDGDSTIAGVATSVDFSITGQAGDVTINYSDAAETGDQTAKLLLTNQQSGNITAAGIERVELTTAGTTTVATNTLTFAAATYISITGTTNLNTTVSTAAADATLVLDGSAKIILNTLNDNIDTVTATANTGGVELKLDTEKNTQVSLGTGDDKVTTATSYAAIATDTALIAAGEGNDTLTVLVSDHLSTAGHFTGFENLVLGDGVSIDLDNITGVTALEITDDTGTTGATNLSSAAAANITLRDADGTLTLEVKGATTANQADTVSITVDDNLVAVTASLVDITTLNMIGVETLNVVANDGTAIDLSEAANDGLSNLTLSGAADVDINTGDLATTTMAIDGNAVTGALIVDASDFAGTTMTITGGSGVNTLTGGASTDTITGGAANDTILGGAGADTLDGAAGTADILSYADVTTATSHALANLSGMAINLSTVAITDAAISTAMGGTIVIGGGAGIVGTDLAAGTAGYLTTSAANSTVTMVRDTISNFELVTGSALADYIVGSANGDTIDGAGGNDHIIGGAGADTLSGGAGTADVLSYTDVTSSTSHSLANLSGMAINLSAAAVTAATINTAMGGTVVIGGGAGVAGADLAAGSAGYLVTTAANSTATMVRDTVATFEQVIGSSLADYIAASANGDTITAGAGADTIIGGAGGDTITGGAGIDIITLGAGVDTVVVAAASVANYDQITGFNAGGTGTDDNILAADTVFAWFGDGAADNDGVVALSTGATIKAAEAADDDATILTISTDAAANTFDLFMAGTDNEAAFEAKIITALGLTGAASTTDVLLIAVDDGEHTGLFQFTGGDAATDNAVDAAEIQLIGIMNGVTDATTLAAGDFLFA